MALKKIGLLGGSFDPVHVAHIALARTALHVLKLDQVQLIPAAHPWQRGGLQATAQQRCEMIRLAIADDSKLSLNTLEIDRGGLTYTIDTIRALPPGASYIWILGADQLANFCSWQQWQAIVDCVDLAVAMRPSTPLTTPPPLVQQLNQQGRHLYVLPFPTMQISASDIRQKLAHGLPTTHMLPDSVRLYIASRHLYQLPT